ncbi:tyrosine-type recombinase/integrase [Metamycoplasma hominis]|uniref:tyrosine-type recombinase/integrase n=2 Tax=Metamycoplasma hominis TaxID=2098 RepID=UPI00066B56A0|nr:tyrosine-type recombinase/integrase [Metamycoplasma hominis]QKX38425.1 tyrosine-type recombinase/integrase [Metamycoplasma hominis]QKX39125.1 tyrosine-type recombinase/integrase [Metamycoplasma hominis]
MRNIDQLEIFYAGFEKMIQTHNRSAETLKNYTFVLRQLRDWDTPEELIEQINFILNNLETRGVSNNTLVFHRTVFATFCKWYSERTGVFISTKNSINYYPTQHGTRRAYSLDEIRLLLNELNAYKNIKFEIVFKMLLTTGIRVSEWEFINWKELRENNQIILKTAKRNNDRPFRILQEQGTIFEGVFNYFAAGGIIDWTAKTIKNQFNLFKHFVMSRHPEFKNRISAHILRHTFVTMASETGSQIEEIAKTLGHTNSNTTQATYLTYDPIVANKKLARMQHNIVSLISNSVLDETEELKKQLENQRKENERLRDYINNLQSSNLLNIKYLDDYNDDKTYEHPSN